MGRSRYICQQHETLSEACICEMHRGGGVLLILSVLSSATSNHGPQDNMRGIIIILITLPLRKAHDQCMNI